MISKVLEELKKAINTEAEGYSFYLAAADFVEDEKGKELFRQLAKDELEHIKALTFLSVAIEKEGKWVSYEEAVNLSASLGEGDKVSIFPEKEAIHDLLGSKATDIDALNFGMKMEEEAVRHYSKALEESKDKDEISFCTSMVNIEKSHFDLLRWEHDSLAKTGFWCDNQEYTVEGEADQG